MTATRPTPDACTAILCCGALASGGLFISDDIQDNFGFRDFAARLGLTPAVVESSGKYVGLLRKP